MALPTWRWYVYARPAKVLACSGRMLSALSKLAAASVNMRSLRKVCPRAVMVGSAAADNDGCHSRYTQHMNPGRSAAL